jgi:O-antigen ligase
VVAATAIIAVIIGATLAGASWILISALLVLPVLVLRPRDLCLGVYAFLLPFDSLSAVGPGDLTLTSMAGAGLAAVLLGTALVRKELQRPPRPALWWTLFIAWGAVTTLWAMDYQVATSRLPTSISLILFYLVVLSTNITRNELRTVSLFAVAGACAAAVYSTHQFYGGSIYHGDVRASLIAGDKAADPNSFAASLLLPLSLAVAGFMTPGKWLARLAWLGVAATLTFAVLVTGSRGAMVAIAVMIVFYMYTNQIPRRMLIPLIAIFVVLVFFMPDAFFARMSTTADTGGGGRTVVWQGGLVAFARYPLVGAGLNNFSAAYRENIGSAPIYHGILVSGAHNSYLETAVETGVVGLVLLLVAFVAQLRAASRCRKKVADRVGAVIVAYEAGCYAVLTAAFFIGVIWEKWFWFSWILLAVAVRTAPAEQPSGARATVAKPAGLRWYNLPVRSTPGVRLK